ncbi:zinc phosphodiesterase ELAC protein 2-like [Lytechinus variegatus]|uniref:zinc phosphodiesterase ELAC protein 2-like n=1 Tax=Lytechinus variegatus TaxID=7654 RepID=UPI001BB25FDE|nr:zinc phosphodiesterase ELAC protein 2-like [Lytechinus variegatus]
MNQIPFTSSILTFAITCTVRNFSQNVSFRRNNLKQYVTAFSSFSWKHSTKLDLHSLRARTFYSCSETVEIQNRRSLINTPQKWAYSSQFIRTASHWEMAADKAKLRFLKNREKRAQLDKAPQQSSVVSLQIIGNGSIDCPPSVLVISDTSRYLFNCGEGTQRLLMECGTRNLSKLEHIFLTRMTWENVGGAIGMTITLKNIGIPQVTMYGPPNMEEFKKALQIFAKHEAIDINLKPYSEGPFKNETMVVTTVPLFSTNNESTAESTETEHAQEDDGCPETSDGEDDVSLMPDDDLGIKRKAAGPLDVIADMNVKPQNMGSSAKKRKTERPPDMTIAYICKLHDKPGKLLAQKAVQMGLKPNLHFEHVKSGKSVTLDDGRVIKAEDVLGPVTPGQVFIVIECPSEDFIEPVVSSDAFNGYFGGCGDDTASLVLHMCPEEVLKDERYQQWISRFGTDTEHVIFNESCESLRLDASRGQQTLLNQIHEGIFPVLPSHSLKATPTPPQIKINGSKSTVKLEYAEIYNKLHLKPAKGWERDFIISEDKQRYLNELGPLKEFQESLKTLKASPEMNGHTESMDQKYPEVLFLGTGSAMPNKARNVSGILLNFSENKSMIMDCGEGTFGQLCRYYGDKVDDVIASIQCIFISHIHADHHAGLINLLKHWKRVTDSDDSGNNLILIGPKRMFIWLNLFNAHCESFIKRTRFVELADLNNNQQGERSRHEASLLSRFNLKEFNTVYVRHCAHAFGVTLTHQDGWKMVYSGDTMPCDNLIKAGKGADLLIHEATLEDGMEEEAKKKRHSMISEAIEVGQAMEAKFLLLTHFSQRYPKVPLIQTSSTSKIGIAFDNMRVSFSELDLLPRFLPTLKYLFAAEIQELEVLREKKAEKKGINKQKANKVQPTS